MTVYGTLYYCIFCNFLFWSPDCLRDEPYGTICDLRCHGNLRCTSDMKCRQAGQQWTTTSLLLRYLDWRELQFLPHHLHISVLSIKPSWPKPLRSLTFDEIWCLQRTKKLLDPQNATSKASTASPRWERQAKAFKKRLYSAASPGQSDLQLPCQRAKP